MTFEEFKSIVGQSFGDLDETRENQYRQMEALYRDWNSKINVISRKDIDELYCHHVLHSLAVAEYVKMALPETYDALRDPSGNVSILDIGTGGGFPGIPLAILFPGGKFTLCDSIGKKIKVASAVAEALGLENVTTVNARAETIASKFDFIVSRAVTSIENFLPWTNGKYTKGILYLKGGDVMEEISDACRKFRMQPSSFTVYGIRDWLQDPYFDGKVVIFIKGRSFSENNL